MDSIRFYVFYTDTIHSVSGEALAPSYPLFNDVAVNEIFNPRFDCEKVTVKKYFNSHHSLHTIMPDIFGFSPLHYLYEKVQPFFEYKSRGELDLVLVNPYIQECVQVEFKRIVDKKENSIYIHNDKIKKLVQQANRNFDMGFHKVYIGIIIDVIGFKQKTPNIFYRDVSDSDLKKINNAVNFALLNPKVGILIFENIWTSGKSIKDQNGIMVGVYKDAIAQCQPSDLSYKIKKLCPIP